MFFLAGLGVFNLLWLPVLDISYEIQKLGLIIRAPYDFVMWLFGRVGASAYWPLVYCCVGGGLLLFLLGTFGMTGGTNSIIEAGFLVDTLFRTVVTSVADKAGIPKEYALHQNYPNPFNPSTTIQFELPHASDVSFKVYNVLGQEVLTLVEEEKPAGVYNVQFSAESLASGMYVYRLQAGDFVSTKKLIFLK